MSEIQKVYIVEFILLADTETWPDYLRLTMVENPILRRKSKGCPKSTHYLNEIDSREMRGPRVCHLCGRQGHSQSRCSQSAGPSRVGGSGGSYVQLGISISM
ncbi:hypothetical protein Ahy_A10g048431 [Arachis hypogaea]|uniref:CCHC-type domain-containing protein n=1 Tax=Arachis hypogaea TaxID=3818 RepID=A0A445B539_ARAHY|nr:hypothetical protein Ahy_A10g048431 [Arachis hypogaea]